MNKFSHSILPVALFTLCAAVSFVLSACSEDSPYISIERPEDLMHVRALSDSIRLDATRADEEALVLTWDWPEPLEGTTGYDYALKMDIADNDFKTSIPKMPLFGDNRVSFTHRFLNEQLEKWGVSVGQFAPVEVEIIATPRGSDHYVKPMLSKTVVNICGYALHLYVAGSATEVGTNYAEAVETQKKPGEDIYTVSVALQPGEVVFLSARSVEAEPEATMHIDRAGYYCLSYNQKTGEISYYEPLYLIGDATDAGWSLSAAVEMHNDAPSVLSWTGVLSEGELKFACHPKSGLWEDPFYVAVDDYTPAEGVCQMLYQTNSEEVPDAKWYVAEAGIYTITADLENRTVTFGRDHSMDELPVKSVWICGSATPGGWNTPFPEKMQYDFSAAAGTFTWVGSLVAGEIKFPLNSSQYEGAFYLADDFDLTVTPGMTYNLNYFASSAGVDDKKWVITEAAQYKIIVNVLDNTVKFIKQ